MPDRSPKASSSDGPGLPFDPDTVEGDLDDGLVLYAPFTRGRWLGPAAIVGGIGVAGLVALILWGPGRASRLNAWILTAVAVGLLAFAVMIICTGRRAYRELTNDSVRLYLRVQLIGLWAVSTLVLVGSIVGAIRVGPFVAISLAAVFVMQRQLSPSRGGEADVILTRLRPGLIGEYLFAIAAPPTIAVSLAVSAAPQQVVDRYEDQAFRVPIIALLALVTFLWQWRRERPGS